MGDLRSRIDSTINRPALQNARDPHLAEVMTAVNLIADLHIIMSDVEATFTTTYDLLRNITLEGWNGHDEESVMLNIADQVKHIMGDDGRTFTQKAESLKVFMSIVATKYNLPVPAGVNGNVEEMLQTFRGPVKARLVECLQQGHVKGKGKGAIIFTSPAVGPAPSEVPAPEVFLQPKTWV